ncbi:MAG TPA: DNA-deoxyinosine glycosylase [Clostridiales bacterium]|nr:MAG: Uracil DNA glycosylase superfamily protein [Firmicutes bacterium ADurb.Bin262]HOU09261.1 DNA-deoxyinosine glycosylase [Clostridiales bacterium]HQH64243.1 DNA-deoxyinosine glycosylase [Clostridiales bacterium]HQK74377.1 DNA-deoxyinosine glycosylase [Clostridiales bacterium]
MLVDHTIEPVYDRRSKILLLGSFPSPLSRRNGFYYGNPQNRFWQVLCAVLNVDVPGTNAEKRALLLRRGIALWDVLARCDIDGAGDASIRAPVPNDMAAVFNTADIRAVFTTGSTAFRLYQKHIFPSTGMRAVGLPSTSPANRGRWPLEKLVEAYRVILAYLD